MAAFNFPRCMHSSILLEVPEHEACNVCESFSECPDHDRRNPGFARFKENVRRFTDPGFRYLFRGQEGPQAQASPPHRVNEDFAPTRAPPHRHNGQAGAAPAVFTRRFGPTSAVVDDESIKTVEELERHMQDEEEMEELLRRGPIIPTRQDLTEAIGHRTLGKSGVLPVPAVDIVVTTPSGTSRTQGREVSLLEPEAYDDVGPERTPDQDVEMESVESSGGDDPEFVDLADSDSDRSTDAGSENDAKGSEARRSSLPQPVVPPRTQVVVHVDAAMVSRMLGAERRNRASTAPQRAGSSHIVWFSPERFAGGAIKIRKGLLRTQRGRPSGGASDSTPI